MQLFYSLCLFVIKWQKRHLTLLTSTLLCFLLLGCSKQPSDINHEYTTRLSSKVPIKDVSPQQWHRLNAHFIKPEKITESHATLSILELNQLSHCTLGKTVAEHNSALGKVAKPSFILLYQVAFLNQVDDCVNSDISEKLKAQLLQAKSDKMAAIPTHWQRFLHHNQELEKLFSINYQQLDNYAPTSSHDTLKALNTLIGMQNALAKQQWHQVNKKELMNALSTLNQSDYSGQLNAALFHQIEITRAQTQQLEQIDINQLCRPSLNHQSAQVMSNIFTKYYAKKLQPYHNDLIVRYRELSLLIQQLYPKQAIKQFDELLKSTSKEHVLWWQSLYQQCQIKPG